MIERSDYDEVFRHTGYDAAGSTATNVADGFTMIAVGDVIATRPLTKLKDKGCDEVIKLLREGDVTFGNMETNIFDIRTFKGSPQAEYGGAYHVSLPGLGPDLNAMGFNLMSYANNHTCDWGVEGMRETARTLDQNGIVFAGVGENLAQAGAARFLETPRGRVALISFASTFTPLSRAADPAGEAPGRPGVNGLRLKRRIAIPQEMLESLRRIRDVLPGPKPDTADSKNVVLAGTEYKAGSQAAYSYEVDPRDMAEILRNVRRGKQLADFCIATNHGHEPGNWCQEPPDYEASFARKLIDTGADAYIGHGPHQLRGIEIYKGRPILYGTGNFVMDDLRTPSGSDMFDLYAKDPRIHTDAEVTAAEMSRTGGFANCLFYESVIAVSRFENNRLAQLLLYPIELGFTDRLANRGIPRLAKGDQAEKILRRLQELSAPFGTRISIHEGVATITPD